jgi:signal transduction histidine kinase
LPVQLEVIAQTLSDGSFHSVSPKSLWSNKELLAPEERVLQLIPIEELVHEYWILMSTIRNWIEENGFPVEFEEYTYLYEAIFEIVAESVRRYSNFQAEEVKRERQGYLAGIAHQMRGPLSVLLLGLTRLQADKAATNTRLVDSMMRNLKRVISLVNGVMRRERFRESEIPVQPEIVSPRQLVDQLVGDVAEEARVKGLTVEVEADPHLLFSADPDLLGDALANLIRNAVKFTERGRVKVEVKEQGDQVLFRIEDTGPGISLQRQKDLFRPIRPSKAGGAGIGLAITAQAVAAQGGQIGQESTLGKGSVFWFTLPKLVKARS